MMVVVLDLDEACRRAWDLANSGRRTAALDLLRDTLKRHPDSIDVLVSLGLLLSAAGKTEEAEAVLVKATQLSPTDWGALLSYAELLADTGRHGEATESFEALLQRYPNGFVRAGYADYLLSRGDLSRALELATQALRDEPADPNCAVTLAKIYWGLEQYKSAESTFRIALQLNSERRATRYHFGRFLAQFDKSLDEALVHLHFAADRGHEKAKEELGALGAK